MTHDGRNWWRFWDDVFILDQHRVSQHSLQYFSHTVFEEWLDKISTLLTPCNDMWPMVYHRRYPVANDNRRIHG